MSSGMPPILISFSPEQFIYFLIAIVTATAGVILWVKRETDGLKYRLTKVETEIEHIKKEMDEQRPKLREMEILLARLTERLSKRIRRNTGTADNNNEDQ